MLDESDPDRGYNDIHRVFLQALLARQTITYAEAKPLLAAIQTAATPARPTLVEDVTLADFEAYIHEINSQLSPFDFEIRSTVNQTSREQVFALVNTTSDALTQMATTHSSDEIAFVKRVLDAMFDVNNTMRAEVMAITAMQAIKCAKPPTGANRRDSSAAQSAAGAGAAGGLTMTQAEKTLATLVIEGWFELSPKGFYSLTPRALMELRGWLVDTYNDQDDEDDNDNETHIKIKFCHACKDIVTVGQRCPDLACRARLHNHCVRNMFRAQGGQEKCPLCETEWKEAPPVGEKAARSSMRRTTQGSAVRTPGVDSHTNENGPGDSEF